MTAARVYLVCGDDEYGVSTRAGEILDAVLGKLDRTLALEIVDGVADNAEAGVAAVSRCLAALATVSLFTPLHVVWLRDLDRLMTGTAGRAASVKDALGRLTDRIKQGLPPEQVLLLTGGKLDKRSALVKACKAAGELHEHAVPEKAYQVERQAQGQLRRLLEKAGLRMRRNAAFAFLERVGTDTRQMASEVEKLAVYVGRGGEATLDDVKAVTSATRSAAAWDLADAVGARDLGRALAVARQLLFQRESPIRLVLSIESRLNELLLYREAMDCGWMVSKRGYGGQPTLAWGAVSPEAEEILGSALERDPRSTHPFRANLLAQQAGRFSLPELRRCRDRAVAAHERLVSSTPAPDLTIEFLLLSMLS